MLTAASSLAHQAHTLLAHLAANHPWSDVVLAGRAALAGVPDRPS